MLPVGVKVLAAPSRLLIMPKLRTTSEARIGFRMTTPKMDSVAGCITRAAYPPAALHSLKARKSMKNWQAEGSVRGNIVHRSEGRVTCRTQVPDNVGGVKHG